MWKRITYNKLEHERFIRPGTEYQACVNNILKYDIFKNEKYQKETMKYKAMNEDIIEQDFFVSNIDKNKFCEILKKRSYMFSMNYIIPDSIKSISIIGEIKTSKDSIQKKSEQNKEYLLYSKEKTKSDILFVLMYILDKSYKDFVYSKVPTKVPIVYVYVPKLYKENCN